MVKRLSKPEVTSFLLSAVMIILAKALLLLFVVKTN